MLHCQAHRNKKCAIHDIDISNRNTRAEGCALICYILHKTFDKVRHKDPFELLVLYGKDVKQIQNLYWE